MGYRKERIKEEETQEIGGLNMKSEKQFNRNLESGIDWEQRRYEIAKEMLPIIYYDDKPDEGEDYLTLSQIVNEAVRFADTLIKELKKSHE